ncbi:hypothetical protein BJ138DRAFT_1112067 [Hygrophoropsis aurantiaca]|uniref:Uncharacterized protein n=1 Tax=Hygrophoropsis aurantiaca TaxID=72124 RepID=A0ACB8AHV8_9AGAM|nr:hypothetical protein BJ138DRAFT_1112067 [Hygrophoropsis aurantiaca]
MALLDHMLKQDVSPFRARDKHGLCRLLERMVSRLRHGARDSNGIRRWCTNSSILPFVLLPHGAIFVVSSVTLNFAKTLPNSPDSRTSRPPSLPPVCATSVSTVPPIFHPRRSQALVSPHRRIHTARAPQKPDFTSTCLCIGDLSGRRWENKAKMRVL